MAFIERKDPVVLNIKLTSKGRELLSKGQLTFKYFAVGDSEIDYKFNNETGLNPFNSNILRPTDKNPQLLSFIPRNFTTDINTFDPYNEISAVPSIPTIIENNVQPIGFFNAATDEFLVDTNHVKQPDIAIIISGVTGGTDLSLNKAPTYLGNVNEPESGDLLLVRWVNPKLVSGNTTGYTINKNEPTPYLMYKIHEIVSGSLSSDDLIITVDKELPNFGGSGDTVAGGIVYYDYINYTGSCYSTDDTDNALISFLQNCQCPTVTFPFWNMSIIFTDNIIGVRTEDKQYGDYNTNEFGGFVSYIQNQAPVYKKLGVIHYTNNSVSNTYGESFYGDPQNPQDMESVPTLDIPLVMWHKSTGGTVGLELKASGSLKYLTGTTKSLNTRYFDLSDDAGNVVGKVFYDLKLFVIEDQELLFAMSYKSNRSWTLPNYGFDINANVTFGCPDCVLTYSTSATTPTTINGSNGTLTLFNIKNNIGFPDQNQILLKLVKGGVSGTEIYFAPITGDTSFTGLTSDIYYTEVYDLGAPNCIVTGTTLIEGPQTILGFTPDASGATANRSVSYFTTEPYQNNPIRIKIEESVVAPDGFLDTGYVTISPIDGIVPTTIGVNPLTDWVLLSAGGNIETANLTFLQTYIIYVRDVTGGTSTITSQDTLERQSWGYYVAVGSPFTINPNAINLAPNEDEGGTYVQVANYLNLPLDPNINPIIGDIEICVYKSDDIPFIWTSTNNDGAPVNVYYEGSGEFSVKIRQRMDGIIVNTQDVGYNFNG